MSDVIDITDAVVTWLNAGSFSQDFTAERHYQPKFELAALSTLTVAVVPRSRDDEPFARNRNQLEVGVDIGVMHKPADLDNATLDALCDLVEEIIEYFHFRRLAGMEVAWVKTVNDPIFAPDHLRELRQFTSVISLTYRTVKDAR